MSTSSIDHRLSDVRRRVRQVLVTHGMSWLAAVGVGSVLLVCLADWLVHFDDPIVRLIFGLAIVTGTVWVARRHLIGPLQVTLTDTDLALRIEDRYPGFRDSLASTVQFLRSGADPRVGSPALQKSVVDSTLDRLADLDTDDVVNIREVRRIAGIALGVCLTALLVAVLNHSLTAIALKRLVLPFSGQVWPKNTTLQLLNADFVPFQIDADRPLQIARGDTLKIFAENTSGRLPPRVTLEYRFPDKKVVSETMRPTTATDGAGNRREVAIGQLLAVRGELEFRAVGGDDDMMAWHKLLVIPPPVVEKLQVTLHPPAYTHPPRKPKPEPDGVGNVQGLVGTRVTISARANKPVEKATLRVKDQERHAVKLGADRQKIEASFVIRDAGVHSWWLELQDAEGFEDGEPPRYEVRGIQDFEPEIYIEQPASDMQVTTNAVVDVRTTARDDLGLKQIRLVYKIEPAPADTPEEEKSLFLASGELPLSQTSRWEWAIESLNLEPGSKIVFHTEATDEFDLSDVFPKDKAPLPHVGRSVTRTLTIVSSATKSQEIAQRQEGLLDDLERAFKLEQQAHNQIDDLVAQIEKADKVRPEDVDALQRTEMGQREVAAQLGNPTVGIEKRARDLADELRNNKIDDPASERRLERIADELGRIGPQHLAPIEKQLTQARKLVQSRLKAEKPLGKSAKNDPAKDRPEEALREVADNQKAVLESLSEILQDLSQWRGEHDASREVGDLVRQQSELNQRTSDLAKQTLTKSAEALTPQEKADLAKIGERQKKHADQLEQLESRMQATVAKLASENPAAAAALKEAVEQSQQESIAGEMRDAAGQIDENRMGQAARTQQEILQKLRDLDNTLRQKRESDTEMLVKKVKQAAADLQHLHDRQADLMQKIEEARQNADAAERQAELEQLRKEQEKLREETARMARRLARLEARRPQASTERAAARMQKAEDDLENGDESGAGDQQQEALDDLEQAQRELARQQRALEEQLAQEQLAKVADEMKGMIPRQQALIDNTRRLDELHAASGKWSRAQLVSLRELAKAQATLAEEAGRIIEKLSAAEVFALALKGAAHHMQTAGRELADRNTGAATQKLEEAARQRLVDLVEALKPDEPDPNRQQAQNNQEGGGSGGQQNGAPTDGIPTLAQIKMLITLQKELFARTAEIDRQRGKDGQLSAAARQELDAIADEQGQLADLTRNLSAVSSPDEESQPEDKGSGK